MNSDICIEDISLLKDDNHIIIQREKGMFSISNFNDGFNYINAIIMHSHDKDVEKIFEDNNISPESMAILKDTDISNLTFETLDYVTAIVSARNSSLYAAGDKLQGYKNLEFGSINIILLINKNISYNTLMSTYSKAIEAKVASLWDLDVRSKSGDLACGSIEDNLIVACTGKSNKDIDYEELQYLVGKCVRNAIRNSMLKNGYSKSVLEYIEGVGITIDDLVEAGMELCIGVEETEGLHDKLRKQILKSLEDLNVVSFIIAGIRLEEDYAKHRVSGVNVDDDPAYLYSDEVFGMSVANQIAGTKAIFNFKRYDEEKPGIIGKLGPVLDDVFAGLVAGCMSKIFEE
ncbi:phosphatidylglycerophosphatase A [Methanobacterium sp. ACI-7]|uniref:phosphatidylglycerophosphatase A n=1 Tax=unclassified Methanobacterium TaxID=2627676 RepID=UPI0039C01D28